MRQSCDSFCVHNWQETTLVCTTAIENILSTTPIVGFCMPYCNCQHFYRKITFVWTTATITIHHIITVIDFWMHNGNWHLFMHYCNWLLLYALLKLTTFVWTVATACCRPALTTSVTLIATMHISSIQHYSLYKTRYELVLWLVELLLQLQM